MSPATHPKSRFSLRLAAVLTAALVLIDAILTVVLSNHEPARVLVSNIYTPAVTLLSAAMLSLAAWRYRGERLVFHAWLLLALAQLAYALGDIAWAVIELTLSEPPFPSLADAFYLLFYPLFAAGLILLPIAVQTAEERLKSSLDMAVTAIGASLVFGVLLIVPIAAENSADWWTMLLSVAYPAFDLVLLLMLLRLLMRQDTWSSDISLLLLSIGTAVMIVSDVVFTLQSLQGSYVTGGWADTGYVLAAALVGLAGVSRFLQPASGASADRAARSSSWALLLPYLWGAAAYLLLIWGYTHPLPVSPLILAWGMGLIFVLTFVRQFVVLRENMHLYQQEQRRRRLAEAMTQASRELTGSLNPDEVPGRVLDQLAQVVPFERCSIILRLGKTMQIVAQRGFPTDERVSALRILIRQGDVFEQMAETRRPRVIDDVTLMPGWQIVDWLPLNKSWMGVPLIAQDRAIGMISLTRRPAAAFQSEETDLALAFAGQAAIALENARLYGELNRAYHNLAQLDKTKSSFIEITAHELRTPLTVIKGYAQVLGSLPAFKDNPSVRPMLDGILNGMTRMHEIVNNMLDVTKIDSQSLQLSRDLIVLSEVIKKVQRYFTAALEERRLSLILRDLGRLPPIHADPDLLYKVFYHLIMNAIKYTPDGGAITVTGEVNEAERWVEIAVGDTGIGIDSDQQELIFEKFYQTGEVALHSSGQTKFKGGGPGLGLAIVKGIVLAHGGQVWVDSLCHNEETYPGSHFHVRLPLS